MIKKMNDTEKLAALEAESDRILDALFDDPGNEALIRRLNEIDVKIVCLTGEKVLDCITL